MSSIVHQYDKRSGITYAYESTSYYDKEKKQPRAKRKLIGRVDPVTGEIVPTSGRRSSAKSETIPAGSSMKEKYNLLKQQCSEKDEKISELNNVVLSLRKENKRLTDLLARINSISTIK